MTQVAPKVKIDIGVQMEQASKKGAEKQIQTIGLGGGPCEVRTRVFKMEFVEKKKKKKKKPKVPTMEGAIPEEEEEESYYEYYEEEVEVEDDEEQPPTASDGQPIIQTTQKIQPPAK